MHERAHFFMLRSSMVNATILMADFTQPAFQYSKAFQRFGQKAQNYDKGCFNGGLFACYNSEKCCRLS